MPQTDIQKCERLRVYAGCFVLGMVNIFIIGPLIGYAVPFIGNFLTMEQEWLGHLFWSWSFPAAAIYSLPIFITFSTTTGLLVFFSVFLFPTPRELLKGNKLFMLYAWLAYSSSIFVFYGVTIIILSTIQIGF